jgi:hypothetical protein
MARIMDVLYHKTEVHVIAIRVCQIQREKNAKNY